MLINKIKVIGYKNHEIILLNLINLNTLIMFSNLNIHFITTVNSSKLNMYPKMVNNNIVMFSNINKYLTATLNRIKMFSSLNKYLTTIINNILMFSNLNTYNKIEKRIKTFSNLKIYPKMENIIKMVNRINIIYMYKHNQCIKQYIQIIEHQCILKIVKHLFINQINK